MTSVERGSPALVAEHISVLSGQAEPGLSGDPGDPGAMLEICQDVLAQVAKLRARLPSGLAQQVDVALGDLGRYQLPEPLVRLFVPPPETLVLGDGRWLYHADDVDGTANLGRGAMIRFWTERDGKGLSVGASDDLTRHGRLLHVSLSYRGHLPSWKDVRLVKERFFGDVDAMLVLPKAEDYVNVHRFCFQLCQMPARWAVM